MIYHKNKAYDFYIPDNKREFIEFLQERRGRQMNWKKLNISQLREIYIQIRILLEDERNSRKSKQEQLELF